MTEDTFMSAALKLSAECVGGIDAHLSDVSSDFSDEEQEKREINTEQSLPITVEQGGRGRAKLGRYIVGSC